MNRSILAGAAALAILHGAVAQAADAAPPAPVTAPPAPLTKEQQRNAEAAAKAAELEDFRKNGSWYLRCDGNPNNLTGGESFARLVGAVTLLGLLAPAREMADPAKRQFGAKGVEACSQLIDDPQKGEHNVIRRLPLILARAAHRIEAKDFSGAVADVGKARAEAQAANLVGNPYFDRSMGLSFDLLEGEARLRLGDPEGSTAVRIRGALKMPWSWYPKVAADPYLVSGMALTADELRFYDQAARLDTLSLLRAAIRLEDAGRFAEAAARRETLLADFESQLADTRESAVYAGSALTLALAGQWELAAKRAEQARQNLEARRAEGKAEADASNVIELLDLYGVVAAFHAGKVPEARRVFTARSEWTAPSAGALEGVAALLLPGSKPEEQIGMLAETRLQRENRRRERMLAALAERDKNNRTLFSYILPYASVSAFEAQSKQVWNTQKSKMAIVPKEPRPNGLVAYFNDGAPLTQPDALLLHAALTAKAQGKMFNIFINGQKPSIAWVRLGSRGDGHTTEALLIDPDPVIAELGQVIPSPEALAQRAKAGAAAK
ncbi:MULTISPECIES: hypothetical protein [unclassified Novosphingobium]|uniref:hypothetical protein n=1 Tax=unclassified Novosphingobium TaxID=2644732 RepID=UPI00146AB236|nr:MULTISPECIES: hypothetical protein [unclassified Novosphingobium]NMN07410.1 hypothetical protein [Novosphingobium sp. SG919]NMN89683.1 hypothetical protein [Novosphingobium sp. SG916]